MDYYIAGSMSGLDFHSAEKLAAENFPSVHRYIGNSSWHVSHLATSPVHEGERPFMVTPFERLRLESPLEVFYKNWRGEVALRRLHPIQITFKSTEWHPEPQWILVAYDLDKKQRRDFALKDFNPMTFPQDYEGIGKRLLEIGAMCDNQEIARTAYDAATALASPVAISTDAEPVAWQFVYLDGTTSLSIYAKEEAEYYERRSPSIACIRPLYAEPVKTAPAVAVKATPEALEQFTAYFVKNYPGPDTIIFDPKWHAPKIFRAAISALSAQVQDDPGDGRPCTMDEFVAALIQDCADPMDRMDAIDDWLYGDWAGATSYLKPETLKRIMSEDRG